MPPASAAAQDEAPPAEQSLSELGAQVVTWLDEGKTAAVRAMFDDDMSKAVPEGGLTQIWAGLEAKLGNYAGQSGVTTRENGEHTAVLVASKFEVMPMVVHVVFDAERRIAGLFMRPSDDPAAFGPRPQHPKAPFPYAQREVSYENPADKSTIAGTLTVPEGAGPHPVVLLITGSGSQDRDETIFGHKPFWVIADHLSRHGIAALRVDDRSVGKSTGEAKGATIETHAGDVEAGIAFLKQQKEVDPKRIGLAGHSEGGIIAAKVGARSADVAFIVSLAGTGLPGSEINPMQIRALLEAQGEMSKEGIEAVEAAQRKLMKMVADGTDKATLAKGIGEAIETVRKHVSDDASMKEIAAQMEQGAAMLDSAWFRSFVTTDPADDWRRVKVPVLALVGEKDLQVPAGPNLKAIAAALRKAGNRDATTEELPGLNHLFQTAKTGLPGEYMSIQETFSPSALGRMTSWIRKRTKLE